MITKRFDVPATNHAYWSVRMRVNDIIDSMKIPYNSGVDVMDVYRTIVETSQKEKKSPWKFEWSVTNTGVLMCDGKKLKRVAPIERNIMVGDIERADYFEGRILATGDWYTM